MSAAALGEALARAEAHAPFLRGLIKRFPDTSVLLAAGRLDEALVVSLEDGPVGTALRRARGRLALAVAVGDLAGLLTLEQVTGHLSAFADLALDRAIAAAIEDYVPGEEPRGFVALALGKQGGHELNYSSDLDPILLFDPATLPRQSRDDPSEAAVRIARKVVDLLQTRDGDGYVFRVDLRLRPTPEITPVALPVDAAIGYYESQALAWERAAFIRARAAAGDVALGQAFLAAIQPFIWRRGLDFGAVQEIMSISSRIRDHYAQGQDFGPGYDLKRGRGGIRECEFFAQIHQLIYGGREPGLRQAATVPALNALAAAGRIDSNAAVTLTASYRLYRTIEHRLQMVDDQQTHELPQSDAAMDNVARLHGLKSGKALLALLRGPVEAVGKIYDGLDHEAGDVLPTATERLEDVLRQQGFATADASHFAKRIQDWRGGKLRAVRTPAAHAALEAMLPRLVHAFAKAPEAVTRFDRLIERLPSAVNLFRLIEAQPALLDMLTLILCHAPTLAEALARRSELLDGLIDATALDPPGSVDVLAQRMRIADHLEQQLDRVRQIVGELRFALGTQIVLGAADPMAVAAGYARVAEAAVQVVAEAVIAGFEQAHGKVAGSELVILALGRLGGGELTHASDLDLIYLFTGDFQAESVGAKPLGAVHYFNRLAQRVTAGLSVATAAGPLYEVDTRLRPSGAAGPLCVSLEGFTRYQREDAWTWEHMALARARVIFGSTEARAATTGAIEEALLQLRNPAKVRADAIEMRRDIAEHKPPKSPLDVKLSEGGLVDLEFSLHTLQLTEKNGLVPSLAEAIAALGLGNDISNAHVLLTRFLVTMRLVAPDLETPVAATQALVASACGAKDWASLLADLASARQSIATLWTKTQKG
jgi:glutamate-ammonia-ligase adenylyltransferase